VRAAPETEVEVATLNRESFANLLNEDESTREAVDRMRQIRRQRDADQEWIGNAEPELVSEPTTEQ
jgi:hypothetical protein